MRHSTSGVLEFTILYAGYYYFITNDMKHSTESHNVDLISSFSRFLFLPFWFLSHFFPWTNIFSTRTGPRAVPTPRLSARIFSVPGASQPSRNSDCPTFYANKWSVCWWGDNDTPAVPRKSGPSADRRRCQSRLLLEVVIVMQAGTLMESVSHQERRLSWL